jgi:hypothetical protein
MPQPIPATKIISVLEKINQIYPATYLKNLINAVAEDSELSLNAYLVCNIILDFFNQIAIEKLTSRQREIKETLDLLLVASGVTLLEIVLDTLKYNNDVTKLLKLRTQLQSENLNYIDDVSGIIQKINTILREIISDHVSAGKVEFIQDNLFPIVELQSFWRDFDHVVMLRGEEYVTLYKLHQVFQNINSEAISLIKEILECISGTRVINKQNLVVGIDVQDSIKLNEKLFAKCDVILGQSHLVRAELFFNAEFDTNILCEYLKSSIKRSSAFFRNCPATYVITTVDLLVTQLEEHMDLKTVEVLVAMLGQYVIKSNSLSANEMQNILYPIIRTLLNDRGHYNDQPQYKVINRRHAENFIRKLPDVNTVDPKYGSILHLILYNYGGDPEKVEADVRIIKLLLMRRVDCINTLNLEGKSALEAAAFIDREVFEMLLFPITGQAELFNSLLLKLIKNRQATYRSLLRKLGSMPEWKNYELQESTPLWDSLDYTNIEHVQIFFNVMVCNATHRMLHYDDFEVLTPVIDKLHKTVKSFPQWMVRVVANLIFLSRQSILMERLVDMVRHKIYEYLAIHPEICSAIHQHYNDACIEQNMLLGNQLCLKSEIVQLATDKNNLHFLLLMLKIFCFLQNNKITRNNTLDNPEKLLLQRGILNLLKKGVDIQPIREYLETMSGIYVYAPTMLQGFEARLLTEIIASATPIAENQGTIATRIVRNFTSSLTTLKL